MIAVFGQNRMKMRGKLDKKGTSNNFLPQHDKRRRRRKKNTREQNLLIGSRNYIPTAKKPTLLRGLSKYIYFFFSSVAKIKKKQ